MSDTTAKKVVALKGLAEDLYAEIRHLRQRADRAERILAALREPSEAVWKHAYDAYWSSWDGEDMWTVIIRAAVAAAEREVGG